jgi:hypothetical protein
MGNIITTKHLCLQSSSVYTMQIDSRELSPGDARADVSCSYSANTEFNLLPNNSEQSSLNVGSCIRDKEIYSVRSTRAYLTVMYIYCASLWVCEHTRPYWGQQYTRSNVTTLSGEKTNKERKFQIAAALTISLSQLVHYLTYTILVTRNDFCTVISVLVNAYKTKRGCVIFVYSYLSLGNRSSSK